MKIKVSFLFTSLSFSTLVSFSQGVDFSKIDKLASNIPDSITGSSSKISKFINSNFAGKEERLRAIYVWVSKNIFYDVSRMNSINYYQNHEEIIDDVLKTKKGICTNYAFLFNSLAQNAGIKSYVIFGRSKQFNKVDDLPHAWCAAKIDTSWFLFDPTWGAGSIDYQNKFNPKFTDKYFRQTPEDFINEHFPFDPLWQFLNPIVTFNEFNQSKNPRRSYFFNNADSLKKWDSLTKIEQLKGSIVRIESTDEKDQVVTNHLEQVRTEIENYFGEYFSTKYNSIVLAYNESLNYLNQFISNRNRQTKDYDALKKLLNRSRISLDRSKSLIKDLAGFDSDSSERVIQLKKSITTLEANVNSQSDYLNKQPKK